MMESEFTQEEILNKAIGNAGYLWYTTILYLKSKGMSVEEWAEFVGKVYASTWEGIEDQGALAVMREAALNWVSCGAKLVSISGDDSRAESVLEWPPEWIAATLVPEVHAVNTVFIPITQQFGLKCSWESEGKQFTLTFSRE